MAIHLSIHFHLVHGTRSAPSDLKFRSRLGILILDLDLGSSSPLFPTCRPRSVERVLQGPNRNGPRRLVPGEPVTLFPLVGERSVPCLLYTKPRSLSCVVRIRPMPPLLRHALFRWSWGMRFGPAL